MKKSKDIRDLGKLIISGKQNEMLRNAEFIHDVAMGKSFVKPANLIPPQPKVCAKNNKSAELPLNLNKPFIKFI